MQKKTKSVLEELNNFHRENYSRIDNLYMLESRIHNVISVISRLFENIDQHYNEEESSILKRKFLNAVRDDDSTKFIKFMRRLNANKKNN